MREQMTLPVNLRMADIIGECLWQGDWIQPKNKEADPLEPTDGTEPAIR